MSVRTTRGTVRRRTVAAASGLAALALVLGACGEEGSAEDAVGSATSAVGSAAAEATSAVGSAVNSATADRGTSESPAPGDGGDEGGEGGEESGGESTGNPDQDFLRDIRAVGVDAADEQGYLTRGRDACTSLDGGKGYTDVLGEYNSAHSEAPITEGPVVVAAAVKNLCSQHLPQIGGDGGEQGGEG